MPQEFTAPFSVSHWGHCSELKSPCSYGVLTEEREHTQMNIERNSIVSDCDKGCDENRELWVGGE